MLKNGNLRIVTITLMTSLIIALCGSIAGIITGATADILPEFARIIMGVFSTTLASCVGIVAYFSHRFVDKKVKDEDNDKKHKNNQ